MAKVKNWTGAMINEPKALSVPRGTKRQHPLLTDSMGNKHDFKRKRTEQGTKRLDGSS